MAQLLEVQRVLGRNRTVVQVSPAGLAEAREGLPHPKPVGSAVVLGRRALRPLAEWSRIDPVRLGLAEYQSDLDEARLRAALEEAREEARIDRTVPSVARANAVRLGPGVRSIDELKPGAIVSGVVTSLTPFGAFVNLGLEQEGLIHVSEIADRFVKDPAEVVRIGQTVLAKVLSIDPERRRVSLSLRREERPRPKAEAANARSKALNALDQLFKK
jgi:transcriptional accessory protein Tex/SPT6